MVFNKLYINTEALNYPLTRLITSKIRILPEVIYDQHKFFKELGKLKDIISSGKKILYLTINKGNFIKKCPGTNYYRCCNYSILHIGSFCCMDCSYCILQTYFHPAIMQFFVNFDSLEIELDRLFTNGKTVRIGTGEFTDSLIWESLTEISKLLIKKFSYQSKTVLEIKTKTANVTSLKKLSHNRKTILSWSLNTPEVIKNEEKGTASLDSRLKAASRCESWGYLLGFHFDPIIIYEGCKKDYRKVVEKLFSIISPTNIVWISMGTFRFIPSLKPIIQKRFKSSKIVYGEFIRGLDGKMRYFKSLRISLYKYMVEIIREKAPDVCIYLCMEDDKIWKEAIGIDLKNQEDLISTILDNEVIKKCNIIKQ